MPRTKLVNGKEVPLTVEEEAARDAEEADWTAGEAARNKARRLEAKRLAAENVYLEESMIARAKDADAPQEVIDWDTERTAP